MKIINLVGVFLISSFSTPCALKDTPNNLIIEKKEAQPVITNFKFFISDDLFIFSEPDNNNNTAGTFFVEYMLSINFNYNNNAIFIETIETDVAFKIIMTGANGQTVFYIDPDNFNTTDNVVYINLTHQVNQLYDTNTNIYIDFYNVVEDENYYNKVTLTINELSYNLIDYGDYDIFINSININFPIAINKAYIFPVETLLQYYSTGYIEGDGAGSIRGYNVGYEQGYNVGEANGYSMGFNIGYESGYIDGNEGHGDFDFVWLTTLFNSLNAILSVEILNGFRLWYLFAVPLVVALIVGVMKLLR